MNETHHRFALYNYKLGKADILWMNGRLQKNKKPNHLRMQASLASHRAANIILKKILN